MSHEPSPAASGEVAEHTGESPGRDDGDSGRMIVDRGNFEESPMSDATTHLPESMRRSSMIAWRAWRPCERTQQPSSNPAMGTRRWVVLVLALAGAPLLLAACDSPLLGVAEVGLVRLSVDSMVIEEGEALQMAVQITNADGKLVHRRTPVWSSSEPAVVIVDGTGRLSAAGPGQARVTATVADKADTAVIRVVLRLREVAAAADHTCGLRGDGILYCWGGSPFGPEGPRPRRPAAAIRLVAVAGSGHHACALDADGRAYCWGANQWGQLGDGSRIDRSQPAPVAGGLSFRSISAGWLHSCGVTRSGDAHRWGFNGQGQLGAAIPDLTCPGDAADACSTVPAAVAGERSFTSVTAGLEHTCGIGPGSFAYCWGSNRGGRLGVDSLETSREPLRTGGDYRFSMLRAGAAHTCGVTTTDAAVCWGDNAAGQLGRDSVEPGQFAVVLAAESFTSVDTGTSHSCAVTGLGAAYCWDDNSHGQLGSEPANGCTAGSQQPCSQAPTVVEGGVFFRSVSAGHRHTCASTVKGVAHCWGSNERGKLGSRTAEPWHSRPLPASGWDSR